MANERIAWPSPPSATNEADGATTYNMGLRFSLVAPQDCAGITWRVPDSVADPGGGSHLASIWNWDTSTRLASKTFTPVPGGDMDVLFDSVVSLTAGVNYAAAVFTNHYVFHAGTWPITTTSGNAAGDKGVLITSVSPDAFPATPLDSWYYVGPLMVVGADPSAFPNGIAVPAGLGTPAAVLGLTAGPAGSAGPVLLGNPTVTLNRSAAPSGVAVPVALGTPSASRPGVFPAGLAVPVGVGGAPVFSSGSAPLVSASNVRTLIATNWRPALVGSNGGSAS